MGPLSYAHARALAIWRARGGPFQFIHDVSSYIYPVIPHPLPPPAHPHLR